MTSSASRPSLGIVLIGNKVESAEGASIQRGSLQRGDIITEVEGFGRVSEKNLISVLMHHDDDIVELSFVRSGKPGKVVLARRGSLKTTTSSRQPECNGGEEGEEIVYRTQSRESDSCSGEQDERTEPSRRGERPQELCNGYREKGSESSKTSGRGSKQNLSGRRGQGAGGGDSAVAKDRKGGDGEDEEDEDDRARHRGKKKKEMRNHDGVSHNFISPMSPVSSSTSGSSLSPLSRMSSPSTSSLENANSNGGGSSGNNNEKGRGGGNHVWDLELERRAKIMKDFAQVMNRRNHAGSSNGSNKGGGQNAVTVIAASGDAPPPLLSPPRSARKEPHQQQRSPTVANGGGGEKGNDTAEGRTRNKRSGEAAMVPTNSSRSNSSNSERASRSSNNFPIQQQLPAMMFSNYADFSSEVGATAVDAATVSSSQSCSISTQGGTGGGASGGGKSAERLERKLLKVERKLEAATIRKNDLKQQLASSQSALATEREKNQKMVADMEIVREDTAVILAALETTTTRVQELEQELAQVRGDSELQKLEGQRKVKRMKRQMKYALECASEEKTAIKKDRKDVEAKLRIELAAAQRLQQSEAARADMLQAQLNWLETHMSSRRELSMQQQMYLYQQQQQPSSQQQNYGMMYGAAGSDAIMIYPEGGAPGGSGGGMADHQNYYAATAGIDGGSSYSMGNQQIGYYLHNNSNSSNNPAGELYHQQYYNNQQSGAEQQQGYYHQQEQLGGQQEYYDYQQQQPQQPTLPTGAGRQVPSSPMRVAPPASPLQTAIMSVAVSRGEGGSGGGERRSTPSSSSSSKHNIESGRGGQSRGRGGRGRGERVGGASHPASSLHPGASPSPLRHGIAVGRSPLLMMKPPFSPEPVPLPLLELPPPQLHHNQEDAGGHDEDREGEIVYKTPVKKNNTSNDVEHATEESRLVCVFTTPAAPGDLSSSSDPSGRGGASLSAGSSTSPFVPPGVTPLIPSSGSLPPPTTAGRRLGKPPLSPQLSPNNSKFNNNRPVQSHDQQPQQQQLGLSASARTKGGVTASSAGGTRIVSSSDDDRSGGGGGRAGRGGGGGNWSNRTGGDRTLSGVSSDDEIGRKKLLDGKSPASRQREDAFLSAASRLASLAGGTTRRRWSSDSDSDFGAFGVAAAAAMGVGGVSAVEASPRSFLGGSASATKSKAIGGSLANVPVKEEEAHETLQTGNRGSRRMHTERASSSQQSQLHLQQQQQASSSTSAQMSSARRLLFSEVVSGSKHAGDHYHHNNIYNDSSTSDWRSVSRNQAVTGPSSGVLGGGAGGALLPLPAPAAMRFNPRGLRRVTPSSSERGSNSNNTSLNTTVVSSSAGGRRLSNSGLAARYYEDSSSSSDGDDEGAGGEARRRGSRSSSITTATQLHSQQNPITETSTSSSSSNTVINIPPPVALLPTPEAAAALADSMKSRANRKRGPRSLDIRERHFAARVIQAFARSHAARSH